METVSLRQRLGNRLRARAQVLYFIHGPALSGKTSLLTHLKSIAEEAVLTTVLINCCELRSLEDLTAKLQSYASVNLFLVDDFNYVARGDGKTTLSLFLHRHPSFRSTSIVIASRRPPEAETIPDSFQVQYLSKRDTGSFSADSLRIIQTLSQNLACYCGHFSASERVLILTVFVVSRSNPRFDSRKFSLDSSKVSAKMASKDNRTYQVKYDRLLNCYSSIGRLICPGVTLDFNIMNLLPRLLQTKVLGRTGNLPDLRRCCFNCLVPASEVIALGDSLGFDVRKLLH